MELIKYISLDLRIFFLSVEFYKMFLNFCRKIKGKFGVSKFNMNKSYLCGCLLLLKYLGHHNTNDIKNCP